MIGPKLSAGKNVNAPTMTITLTSKKTKSKLSVLKVPTDSGMIFLPEMFPARAITGIKPDYRKLVARASSQFTNRSLNADSLSTAFRKDPRLSCAFTLNRYTER